MTKKGIVMKQRYLLFRRSGVFYYEDTTTGQQLSLRTKDEAEARTLLNARNESFRHPERFAQEALGHNSKAVHRAYAKRALMKIPSLEDYEQRAA
jgi:hypothetical protein